MTEELHITIEPAIIIWCVFIGSSIWVYVDAKNIGVKKTNEKQTGLLQVDIGPAGWGFCCLMIWILAFPLYLCKRHEFKKRFQAATPPPLPTDIPPQIPRHRT